MAAGGLPDFEFGNEETFDYLCSPCKSKNKISEAVKYCVDCYDFYCSGCVKFHDDIPALRRHKILDKGEIPGSLGSQPALPTERCRQHGHKPVDMFCQEHDVVGCGTCMMTDHGSCVNKTYIPDFVKKYVTMVDTSSCRMKLINLVDCLRRSEEDFDDEIERLKSNKTKLIQDVKKLREDIDKRLDELERNTITELEIKLNSLMSEVEDGRKRLRDLMREAQACIDNLGSATDNLTQEFVSLKLADTVTVSVEEQLNAIQDDVKSAKIDIFPEPETLALIQQIKSLVKINETEAAVSSKMFSVEKYSRKGGKVSMSPQLLQIASSKTKMQLRKHDDERQSVPSQRTYTSVPDSKVNVAMSPAAEEQKQRSRLRRVNGVNEYSVRVPSDKNVCDIMGVCVLEDSTVVLADLNNCSLKRLDTSTFVVKDWCDIPWYPWQVCAVSSTEVVVACQAVIVFVDVGSKMKVTRHINTDVVCHGVAYGVDKLYVSAASSLYVYTLSGERRQRFGKDQTGQDLCTSCYSLALSADHTKLYVADSNKGLLVLNNEGEQICQYNGPQLQGARRVCLCQNGDVLIYGGKSKKVLQFSAEGNLIGEVLKVSKSCSAVCCLQNDSKLILSCDEFDMIEICNLV